MVARALIGIALGILFAPIIYLLLVSIGDHNAFANWFWSITQFPSNRFAIIWGVAGVESTIAPVYNIGMINPNYPGLVFAFDPNYSLITTWLPKFLPALITWTLIGAWAGAIERSAGRGLAIGGGIWLGWLLAGIIGIYTIPEIALVAAALWGIWHLLLAQVLTLVVVVIVAAVFGAMTRSEEF